MILLSFRYLGLYLSLILCCSIANGQGSLKAEFYSGKNFEKYVSTRSMDNIDLAWERDSPVPNMDPQKCSIRWTGSLKPPTAGDYKFSAVVDYGIRLWIGGELVIDDWTLHDWGRLDGRIQLEANKFYEFKVEYFNAMFGGEIRLKWDLPKTHNLNAENDNKSNAVIVDSKYFFPAQEALDNVLAVASKTNDIQHENPERPKKQKRKKAKKITKEPQAKDPPPISVNKVSPKIEITPIAISQENMTEKVIEKFKPKSIQFERAQAVILENSIPDLEVLANFLLLNKYLKTQIEGHTDLAGDPDKNMKLSERRAFAVARYLIQKGVGASQLEARGMGGTKPLIQSTGKFYHPENRRVSFEIQIP